MPYHPFRATVVSMQRLSPNFQRVRLSGLKYMGPRGHIHDLRIKLIFPGPSGLVEFPTDTQENWFEVWQSLDPATRGAMRTYSVRELDRDTGILTVDFVLHTAPGQAGPACTWASSATPGDNIYVVAPSADDESGPGIEFQPADANEVHLFGDETALPALARIVDEWPKTLTGTIHIEVPTAADRQELNAPPGVSIEWLPREDAQLGALLIEVLSRHRGLPSPAPETEDAPDPDILWETPAFSSSGEEIDPRTSGGAYWWIAGESGVVKHMRRMLVRGAGIPRSQVSFMGYWKRGAAEG
ncbi:MAG: siderophore-interacting protein [Corynebacterium flavescens]|uniref:siderophore-interacting protein n=1 Tax=Corynebacterium flavescens TaxID=28028 RepID=UPI003F9275D6